MKSRPVIPRSDLRSKHGVMEEPLYVVQTSVPRNRRLYDLIAKYHVDSSQIL